MTKAQLQTEISRLRTQLAKTLAVAVTDRSQLKAIARALGLAVPRGEPTPTLVGRILNAAHQLRADHDTMAARCAEYERTVGRRALR